MLLLVLQQETAIAWRVADELNRDQLEEALELGMDTGQVVAVPVVADESGAAGRLLVNGRTIAAAAVLEATEDDAADLRRALRGRDQCRSCCGGSHP